MEAGLKNVWIYLKSLGMQTRSAIIVKHSAALMLCFRHIHERSTGYLLPTVLTLTCLLAMYVQHKRESRFHVDMIARFCLIFADSFTAAVLIPATQKVWEAFPFPPLSARQAFFGLILVLQGAEILWRHSVRGNRPRGPRGKGTYQLQVGEGYFSLMKSIEKPKNTMALPSVEEMHDVTHSANWPEPSIPESLDLSARKLSESVKPANENSQNGTG